MFITISRGMTEHFLQERTGNISLVWHHSYIPLSRILSALLELTCILLVNVVNTQLHSKAKKKKDML